MLSPGHKQKDVCKAYTPPLNESILRDVEMSQGLRVLAAITKDLSSGPSTNIRGLTTIW